VIAGPHRITWLGHATVLVELGGVRLLTDPVLRPVVAHLRRAVPAPEAPARLDAALVSHLHRDHLDLPSLRLLHELPVVVVPAGARRTVRRLGLPVIELASGDDLMLGPIAVQATRAVHDGRRSPVSRPVESVGFLIERRLRVYFAGDTELFEGMADLAPVDVALLPVAGWGPSLGPGHMDAEQAARAAALLRPAIAIPIHWGTFAPIGLRRDRDRLLRAPPLEFAEHAARLAPGTRVEILQPGGSLALT
jgi:L-ascorbate metabolism protein UlaG (beta-lactamase superfamily)